MTLARVTFTVTARRDLAQIGDQIAEAAGNRVAHRWIERIERRSKDLGGAPEMGARDAQFDLGLRRIILAPYVIFYAVLASDEISILRTLHGRRDLPAIMASPSEKED